MVAGLRLPFARLGACFATCRHAPSTKMLALTLVFFGISTALRLALTDNLPPDEAELVVFAQNLHGGYSEQPPLYTWMLWTVFQATGPGHMGLAIVRGVLLLALVGMTYLTAKLLVPDRRFAIPLAFSGLLFPSYGWHAVTYLTHSLLLSVAVMANVYAIVRVIREGRTFDYLLLGTAVGLGLLAKYNFALVGLAAVCAGLTISGVRWRVLNVRLLLSLGVAVLIALPHLEWLMEWWDVVMVVVRNKSNGIEELPYWEGVTSGLWALALSVAGGMAIILPLFGLLTRGTRRTEQEPATMWLGHFFGALVIAHVVLVVACGVTRFQDRWLQPLLLPLPLWYFARMTPDSISAAQIRILKWTMAAVAVGILAGQLMQIAYVDRLPGRYDMRVDYRRLARELEDAQHGNATIISWDREIIGNLRVYMPNAVMWYPCGVETFEPRPGAVVVMWDDRLGDYPPWGLTPDLDAKYGKAQLWPTRLKTFTLHPQSPEGRTATLFVYRLPRALVAGQEAVPPILPPELSERIEATRHYGHKGQ
jgi:hypothetical protein